MADVSSVVVKAPLADNAGQPAIEPGAFFLDGNYSLQLNSWNGVAGVVLGLRFRILRSDGQLVDSVELHTPNSNFTQATTTHPLPQGFLLNAFIFAASGNPLVGITFAQLQLVRGFSGAITPISTILQDYVSTTQGPSWPGSPIRSSIDGPGALRSIAGTTPGAGAEIIETVPLNVRWQLVSVVYTLTNSATVANRFSRLFVNDGANVYGRFEQPAVGLAASATGLYTAGGNITNTTWQDGYALALPDALRIPGGGHWLTSTLGIQAGDQYSAVRYLVFQWIDV